MTTTPDVPPLATRDPFTPEPDWSRAYWNAQEISPDGFVMLNAIRASGGSVCDFEYAYVNPAGAAIVSRTPADLVGRRMRDVFPFVTENGILAAYATVAETGVPWQQELLYDKDGISVGFRIVAVRLGAQVALTYQDITDRVRAERERDVAIARTQRLQALTTALASAPTSAAITDAVLEQVRDTMSALHVSLLVAEAGDTLHARFVATQLPDTIRDDILRRLREASWPVIDALRTGKPVVVTDRAEMASRFPDVLTFAERLGVEAMIAVPLINLGDRIGVLAVDFAAPHRSTPDELAFLSSVADQCALALDRERLSGIERQIQEELTCALARLDATSQAKSRFMAELSHELRTPLQAISGYLHLLKGGSMGPLAAPQLDALERITRAQHRIERLANEVLELAQLENGESRVEIGAVGVRDALDAAEALIAPQRLMGSLEYDVTFDATLGAPELVRVAADSDRLQQILLNLLANAVKFTPAGGRIGLHVGASGGRVSIAVSDTGKGIPATHLESIFDPFVQAPTGAGASRGDRRGVGLGLAISRHLARRMHGDLRVISERGAGSTFTLTLPAA